MKVRIVVDSVADVKKEIAERLTVVPLNINFGDEQYVDGETMTKEQFYQKLATSSDMPRTSQPSPASFEKIFEEIHESGKEGIVITVASKLSGTYQSACLAAEDYPEISVVDSETVAVGTGILAEYALRCIDRGMPRDEIISQLNQKK